jgi:hypothetical protein
MEETESEKGGGQTNELHRRKENEHGNCGRESVNVIYGVIT